MVAGTRERGDVSRAAAPDAAGDELGAVGEGGAVGESVGQPSSSHGSVGGGSLVGGCEVGGCDVGGCDVGGLVVGSLVGSSVSVFGGFFVVVGGAV